VIKVVKSTDIALTEAEHKAYMEEYHRVATPLRGKDDRITLDPFELFVHMRHVLKYYRSNVHGGE
jgi:hypothetical protein